MRGAVCASIAPLAFGDGGLQLHMKTVQAELPPVPDGLVPCTTHRSASLPFERLASYDFMSLSITIAGGPQACTPVASGSAVHFYQQQQCSNITSANVMKDSG